MRSKDGSAHTRSLPAVFRTAARSPRKAPKPQLKPWPLPERRRAGVTWEQVVVHHAATNWPNLFESQKEVTPPARVEYVLTFKVDPAESTRRRILYLGVLNTRSALHTTRARVPVSDSHPAPSPHEGRSSTRRGSAVHLARERIRGSSSWV